MAGAAATSARVLGHLRVEVAPPAPDAPLAPVWVVDFPLFEGLDDAGRPVPAHHPFTAPHPDDRGLLERGHGEELLAVRSRSYDFVLNGWELASGSVRIHDPALQARVLEVLGIAEETAQARFGFLLDAFRYGAPPHAGFGLGIDRLVAVLAGEDNIREVIAFPKTQSGADPLTGAPTPLDPVQLRDLGLSLTASTPAVAFGRWPTCSAARSRSVSPGGRRSRPGCVPAPSTRSSARPACSAPAGRCGP